MDSFCLAGIVHGVGRVCPQSERAEHFSCMIHVPLIYKRGYIGDMPRFKLRVDKSGCLQLLTFYRIVAGGKSLTRKHHLSKFSVGEIISFFEIYIIA